MDKNWGIFDLNENTIFFKQIGDLRVWIKKIYNEVYISSTHNVEEPNLKTAPEPENSAWSRWAVPEEPKAIEILPLLPDRPVMVRMKESLYIPGNTGKTVFVSTPAWAAVKTRGKEELLLLEAPTQVLSNAWFGNFEAGELCYWFSSSAQSRIGFDKGRPCTAVCPVYLSNKSEENLLVEQFYLPVPNLTLFRDGDRLWSDKITINYKGKNEVSQVVFTGKPMENLSNARKIADPRRVEKKNIFLKSFSSISGIWDFNMER